MTMKQLIATLWQGYNQLCAKLPAALPLLLCRLAIASVFWRSAQTKISGWDFLGQSWQFFNLSDSTFALFEYDYNLPLIPSDIAAYAGTTVEFFMPILLVLGLGTRVAALALFIMTTVIQTFVFPDAWPTHILWFALLLVLLRNGGGRLSLDAQFKLV
jgi:putative oxidoreductase